MASTTPWGASVLLAEDDLLVGDLIMLHLSGRGFHPSWVKSGKDVVLRLREIDPKVLVLDLGLPGLNGFEVLAEIARTELAKKPQILILTARNVLEDVKQALYLGADDYLTKPFRPDKLIGRIERLLVTKRPLRRVDQASADRSVS